MRVYLFFFLMPVFFMVSGVIKGEINQAYSIFFFIDNIYQGKKSNVLILEMTMNKFLVLWVIIQRWMDEINRENNLCDGGRGDFLFNHCSDYFI